MGFSGGGIAPPGASPTPEGPTALPVGPPPEMGTPVQPVQPPPQTGDSIFDKSADWLDKAAEGADPGKIYEGIPDYMNPYQQTVIDNTTRQMQDAYRQMDMGLGQQASQAGAFGGSRHGLAQGQLAADTVKNIGDVTGQLNQSGWNQAGMFANQDIQNAMRGSGMYSGLANQGFNMGRTLNQDQWNMGNAAQQQQQALMNSAMQMFGQMSPLGALGGLQGLLGGSPLLGNSWGQGANTPGMGQSIGAGIGIGGRLMGK